MALVELGSTTLNGDGNLVSYYKLENVNDSKGSNTLTNSTSVTFPAGKFNNAGTFNGTTQRLNRTNGSDYFTGTSDKAFSMWISPSSQPGTGVRRTFLSWGNASHRFYFRYQDTGGTKEILIGDGNNEQAYTQTLSNSTFYNLVVSLSGTTVSTWLDGVLLGTHTANLTAAANHFSLGYQGAESNNYFAGLIDDVAIFSRALTQSDVYIINDIPEPTAGRYILIQS